MNDISYCNLDKNIILVVDFLDTNSLKEHQTNSRTKLRCASLTSMSHFLRTSCIAKRHYSKKGIYDLDIDAD